MVVRLVRLRLVLGAKASATVSTTANIDIGISTNIITILVVLVRLVGSVVVDGLREIPLLHFGRPLLRRFLPIRPLGLCGRFGRRGRLRHSLRCLRAARVGKERGRPPLDEIRKLFDADGAAGIIVERYDKEIDVSVGYFGFGQLEAGPHEFPELVRVQHALPIDVPSREHDLRRGPVAGRLELRLQLLGHRLVDRRLLSAASPLLLPCSLGLLCPRAALIR
mmetsp:Transcript_98102/g.280767  ORF Transcript_98102/g.280767 Transcript_98102/m.280767 type:complete len:222 (+) Transcript_98102:181-846(+)